MEEKKFYPEDLKDHVFSYRVMIKYFPNGVSIAELNPKILRDYCLINVLTKLESQKGE